MKEVTTTFCSAVLAGIAISMGCVVYLRVGGVAGACLFAFGLLTCVGFSLKLYTGTAGFVDSLRSLRMLLVVLGGNIAGCLMMALAMRHSMADIVERAGMIVNARLDMDLLSGLLLSTACGFIMTTAVKFAREKHFLPLLFGVPLFILCGFIHSIADAFYTLVAPTGLLVANVVRLVVFYVTIVVGNFIGCNLYRIVMMRMKYD